MSRETAFKTKLSANPFLALAVIGTFALQIVIIYVGPIAGTRFRLKESHTRRQLSA